MKKIFHRYGKTEFWKTIFARLSASRDKKFNLSKRAFNLKLAGFQLKQPKQNVPLLLFPKFAEREKTWDLRLLYHGLFYLGGGFPSSVSMPSAEEIFLDS
jgi:hypothetical protein